MTPPGHELTISLNTQDPAEIQLMMEGARQVCDLLGQVRRQPFRIVLVQGPARQAPAVSILSLLGLVTAPIGMAELATLWLRQLAALQQAGTGPVFLCTIFRHVPRSAALPEAERWARQERIRRLNLLAAELSQATGVGVIDLDRAFAHIGGGLLQTDFRLGGGIAARVGGDVIAGALLAEGLDDVVPVEVLQQAQEWRGGLPGLLRRTDALVTEAPRATG